MKRRLSFLLARLSWLSAAIAVAVLLTGGLDLELGGVRLRATGLANPIAACLIAAGLRLLLAPAAGDPLGEGAACVEHRLVRLGLGRDRRRAWISARGDAIVLALLAVWVVDRGMSGIVEVEGDGVGYYAYLRSFLMDGDLDFLNEYRDHDPRQQWVDRRTRIGRVENPFSIGPAILWSPFFVVGWAGAVLPVGPGPAPPVDGYSPPFAYACAGGTWLYGLLGAVLTHRLLLRWCRRSTALLAGVGVVLASPLAYYLVFANFYSHALSFFMASLFLLLAVRTAPTATAGRWLVLGLVGGLLALTRWQDATLWIVPAAHLAGDLLGERTLPRLGRSLVRGLAFLAGATIGVAPQLLVFKLLNGYWLGVPQGPGFVSPWPRWLLPTLFSPFHGLYAWSPLLLPATIGLGAAAWARRPWAIPFLLGFLTQVWANASVSQWWAGHSFGARRFASSVPLLAMGLAFLLDQLADRRLPRRVAVGLVLLCGLWTQLLVHQWIRHEIPHGEPPDVSQILAHAGDDVVALRLRAVIGDDTYLALVLARLTDLLDRGLLLAAAAAFYLLARRRAATLPPTSGMELADAGRPDGG